MHRYITWNGPMPTAGVQQQVSTGTTIKTMLQIATPSTRQCQLLSWGFSFDDVPGADGDIELLETDVGATVTAHVASGLRPMDPNCPASLMTLANSGYTASAEGAIAATRVFKSVSLSSVSAEVAPVMNWEYSWMPDERPIIGVSKFLRIRALTPTTAIDLRCWFSWDE